jgi:hypothetical protein
MSDLPKLQSEKFTPTRDHLRDAALVLGSLQRGFLSAHPRDWQHGLGVGLRGILTQPIKLNGQESIASIDLVKHKFRLGDTNWKLSEYDGPELYKNVRIWLDNHDIKANLELPEFTGTTFYDPQQTEAYAAALWWLDSQFRTLKAGIKQGVTSPVLLYPHHFDLSLVWFPWDDERQLGLGWSTGDETITEPYIYLTAYPQPNSFTEIELPKGAYWQKDGFSGAILPYSELQQAKHPDELFQQFAGTLFEQGHKLLS